MMLHICTDEEFDTIDELKSTCMCMYLHLVRLSAHIACTTSSCHHASFPARHAQPDLPFSSCPLLSPSAVSSVKLVKVEWLLACCQSEERLTTDDYTVVLELPQEGSGQAGGGAKLCKRQVEEIEDDIMQLYLGGGAGGGEEQGGALA